RIFALLRENLRQLTSHWRRFLGRVGVLREFGRRRHVYRRPEKENTFMRGYPLFNVFEILLVRRLVCAEWFRFCLMFGFSYARAVVSIRMICGLGNRSLFVSG